MREPFATMFQGYERHWLLGQYLREERDEPDWLGIGADERFDCLSNGEKVLVDFAAAYRNVELHLDGDHQYRITLALRQVVGHD